MKLVRLKSKYCFLINLAIQVCKVMELLIEETLLGVINKEEKAIERCIEFQNRNTSNENILAFSGGKDSLVTYHILIRSGVNFIPIYSPPSVDPPELVNFIRQEFNPWCIKNGYPEVIFQKYKINKNYKQGKGEVTMWSLLRNRALPPTRRMRYCCEVLKERTGEAGDTVYTGVRWEESNSRKKLSMVGFWKHKIMVRPIIDYTQDEIWEYIHKYKLPYCKLYDEGWERVGCIGCPLSKNQSRELELYPKYKANYIRAFEGMIEYRKSKGMETEWETGEDVYKWWIGEIKKEKEVEGQCSMF